MCYNKYKHINTLRVLEFYTEKSENLRERLLAALAPKDSSFLVLAPCNRQKIFKKVPKLRTY